MITIFFDCVKVSDDLHSTRNQRHGRPDGRETPCFNHRVLSLHPLPLSRTEFTERKRRTVTTTGVKWGPSEFDISPYRKGRRP